MARPRRTGPKSAGMRGDMARTQQHVVVTDQEHELTPARFAGKAVAVQLVVSVDEEEHRRHFSPGRGRRATARPHNMRKLQRYVRSMALQHGRATVPLRAVPGSGSEAGGHSINPYTEPNIPPNRKARVGPVTTGIGSGGEL